MIPCWTWEVFSSCHFQGSFIRWPSISRKFGILSFTKGSWNTWTNFITPKWSLLPLIISKQLYISTIQILLNGNISKIDELWRIESQFIETRCLTRLISFCSQQENSIHLESNYISMFTTMVVHGKFWSFKHFQNPSSFEAAS